MSENIPLMDLRPYNDAVSERVFEDLKKLVGASEFIGGKRITSFESDFAKFTSATHAVGVSNGTHALVLALRAAGVTVGDEVITVSQTFIATAEAILEVGAAPIFVDVDVETGLMDMAQVEASITSRTKAVLPVHLYGTPVDLGKLDEICGRHKLVMIQDAAQAHGAEWDGKPLAAYGYAQTYSFFPGKNLGAWGDAGAVTTRDAEVAEKLRAIRDHGRKTGEKYLHDLVGSNYRLDPLQAAVLSAKLPLLTEKTKQRAVLYRHYASALEGVGDIRFFRIPAAARSAHHLFVLRTKQRDALKEHLVTQGIHAGVHYPTPVHRQPAFAKRAGATLSLPKTEAMSKEILSLPFFPEINEQQVERVLKAVVSFFK